jgi:MFS family permease
VAVSLLAAGNLAGRLAAGWWSDRVGRTAALATALAVPATALVGVSVTSAPAVVLVGLCAIGLAYGAVSALVPAATADRVGARAFPAVYGRVFTAWGCAGLAAPLLAEAVTGTGAPPPAMLLIATPLAVAALALRSLARETGGSGTSATARSGADG